MNASQLAVSAELSVSLSKPLGLPPSKLPLGFHAHYPDALYHLREPGLASKSALDWIAQSAAHYKAYLDGLLVEEPTDAMAFGTAFHCALLEPDRFARSYAVEPRFGDCRTKEPKAKRDAWRAANAGKNFLSPEDGKAIAGMVASVHAHALGSRLLDGAQAELTLRWEDPATGLPCKGRVDLLVESLGMAVDVKSASDASPAAFARAVSNFRYHGQDAMYRDGFRALGVDVAHFLFLVTEKTPPYATVIYAVDPAGVARGRSQNARYMQTLAQCTASGVYPGYPDTIHTLSLPPWSPQ